VKLTKNEEKNALLGYREQVPPDCRAPPGGGADGGMP
jgi:hypothetical protein